MSVVPLALTALTLALRITNLTQSYDLFVDEPFYVELGQSVAKGNLPYATGSLFFLHPPGHSLLEAVWIHLVGVQGGVFEQVFTMRYMNVVFAGVTTTMLFLVGQKLCSRAVGVMAAVLFAISPWFIRQNSFVLLETSAMTFVLAGILGLLYLPKRGYLRIGALVAIGLVLGFGVLIKEFAVFVTLLPLVIIAFRRRPGRHHRLDFGDTNAAGAKSPNDVSPRPYTVISRSETFLVIAATCVPYAAWLGIVVRTGNFESFWEQTFAGFRRASGVRQISGFNRPGAPSFISTILANAPQFWTTYLMLGLGSIAVLRLLLSANGNSAVVGAFGFGAIPLLAYSVLAGANEEQFYYYLLIPALIAIAAILEVLWHTAKPILRRSLVVLAIIWVCSDLANWAIIHTVPDNATQQLDQWMRANVADGSRVAVTNDVQRQIFLRYEIINDLSAASVRENGGASYLVVFERQVKQGYAFIGSDDLANQLGGRRPVYSTYGRGNWWIDVYYLH